MPERPAFQEKQYAFAAHVRDPEGAPCPEDVEDRRMKIYRDLLYKNIEGFISGGFPILRELHGDREWHAMVREFFNSHQCRTPYFLEIGQEFLKYLQEERGARETDYPFMLELAHYEWVEVALDVADIDLDAEPVERDGDLLAGRPLVSPLAWPLSYAYPVHRIGPAFRPTEPGDTPTCLIVYRNRDDEVKFMETNPVTLRMLQLLDEVDGRSGEEILRQVAGEMQHPDPDVVVRGGAETLRELRDKDIILGTRASARAA